MKSSKLIDLLRTFNSQELLAFRDWVASPYYNKNQDLIRLYRHLKPLAPQFSEKKVHRELVFQKLFPNQKYIDRQFKYLMSDLLKLAEQFIGYQIYQQQETLPTYHILSGLSARKLEKHYSYLHRKALLKLEKHPLRDANYYYQQYLLADISDKHFEQQGVRKFDESLQNASDNFDLYYLSNKLRYATEMLDRQLVVSAEYKIKLVDEIKPFIATIQQEVPAIDIYNQILITLQNEEKEGQFEKLKSVLRKHQDKFTQYELKQIYVFVLNYCIRKIRQGNRKFAQEALQLYLEGIDSEALFEGKYLSPWTYKNVITLGVGLKRFDWTEKFIYDYNEKIALDFQQDALHYNLADLYYKKGDFDAAQKQLQLVEYSDIYYNLGSKLMLLKIYFETDESEALHSLLASFSIFLKRNKLISSKVKTSYQNLVKYVSKLMKAKPKQLTTLADEVTAIENIMDKSWLLKQLQKGLAV